MMQEKPDNSFDDPAIKAALRRSLGTDGAPVHLKDRIRQAVSEQQNQPIPLFRRQAFRQAIAAVLAIGMGVAAILIWRSNNKDPYQAAYAIPNSLYKTMVKQHHDRADQTTADPITSLASAKDLSTELHRPLLVPDLTKDGWTFKGASIRNWPNAQVAQFFFTKGDATISLLSMPASVAPGAQEAYTYQTTFSGTPIAGVVKEGGLHCLIGTDKSGAINDAALSDLLHRHMDDMVRG